MGGEVKPSQAERSGKKKMKRRGTDGDNIYFISSFRIYRLVSKAAGLGLQWTRLGPGRGPF